MNIWAKNEHMFIFLILWTYVQKLMNKSLKISNFKYHILCIDNLENTAQNISLQMNKQSEIWLDQ